MTNSYQYQSLISQQRDNDNAPTFCMFFPPAGEVLEWAAIQRLEDKEKRIQRIANPAKIRGIKRFFESDTRNTIPAAVIVALDVQKDSIITIKCEEGRELAEIRLELEKNLSEADKPGLVIDGQHRLLGVTEFDPTIPVPVVALLNPSALETAFQFLVINNKVSKVSTDHIRALALDYNREGFEERLRTARLSLQKNYEYVGLVDNEDGSPFQHCIDWPANRIGEKLIVPAAIEGAIQYILDQDLQPLKEDDSILEFFYAVWAVVKSEWGELWQADSRLLSKVGIICLTRHLTDNLVKRYEWGELELTDPESVSLSTEQLLKQQSSTFWSTPWKSGGHDTSVGRQLIVDDLAKMTRNLRADISWHEGLKVIDLSELSSNSPED